MRANRLLIGLTVLAFLAGGGLALAADDARQAATPDAALGTLRAHELDTLFAELKTARTPDEGARIEHDILDIWHESGDAHIDRLLRLSIVAMNMQAYQQALFYLDQVVTMKPDFAEGWNKRATVYFYVDDFAHSMADIEQTLVLEPRHFGALAGLGMIMVRVGDRRHAIDAFKKALEVYPTLQGVRAAVDQLEQQIGEDL